MKEYIVLYYTKSSARGDDPFGMRFWADDPDHAEEQLLDAEPDGEAVWVFLGNDYRAAIHEYWSQAQGNHFER